MTDDSEEYLGLTEKGKATVLGIVSSLCHGFDLDQTATLNDCDDADEVRVMLMFLLAEAGIIEPMKDPEDDEE